MINSANASRQADNFWTDDREEILRNLWGAGEFASDIAIAIGDGCTPSMVIGKANRLKLAPRKDWNRFGNGRHKSVIRVARETRMSEGAA
jgi:hypothetical protein